MGVPQHVRHDEKSYVASPDVDLVEVADSTVTRGYGDVFELDVHVVFGYWERGKGSVIWLVCRTGESGLAVIPDYEGTKDRSER